MLSMVIISAHLVAVNLVIYALKNLHLTVQLSELTPINEGT